MRIVLLGAPGCGKGTQGHRLATHYKIPEISTGEILRQAVAAGTPLGRAAKAVMDAGQLVSDDIVLGVIRERLSEADVRKGFVLDGFPRNLEQAEQLDELLDQISQPIELAILIDTDLDLLMQRLLGRRTCRNCGASFNMFTAPPKMDDSCDECGGRLKRRPDDNEETIGNRMRIYEMQTAPVTERYREQQRLRVVQGVGDIADVFAAIMKTVEEARPTFGKRSRSVAIRQAVARQQSPPGDDAGEQQAAQNKPRPKAARSSDSAKQKKPAAGKKPAVKKKAVTKKKAAAKKKALLKKKVVAKKKVVVKKKAVIKKKAIAKKKAIVKKKAAAKKKSLPKKKVASKKKSTVKKKVASKKKVVAKKKTAVNKKSSSRKKPTGKNKVVVKKKAVIKKKAVAKKKAIVKKKVAAKKKAAGKR